jgi:hypothetical protein
VGELQVPFGVFHGCPESFYFSGKFGGLPWVCSYRRVFQPRLKGTVMLHGCSGSLL